MFAPISQGLNLVPLNFFQIEPNMRDPYFQQWNVALQKVVARVISVEGAYVASKGSKIESNFLHGASTPEHSRQR
jgi:hypothetical protein